MDVLPSVQQQLWSHLNGAANLGFVLYGGTAIALRLGHRQSVDFDFFCETPLDRVAIAQAMPFIARSTAIQDANNSWSLLVPHDAFEVESEKQADDDSQRSDVKISFFGTIGFGRVGEPSMTEDGVMQVASMVDLMATKLKVVLQRAEAKDYRDVAAMLNAGASLAHGLASARAIFGPNFQPSESLKALVYFADGDLHTLSAAEKSILVSTVSEVRDLPVVSIVSKSLSLDKTSA